MKLTVITPEKTLLDSIEVEEILVPGTQGEMGILPGHTPLISVLGSGILKYCLQKEKTFQEIAVSWGYCEVQIDKVIVLAESAETKQKLDKEKTQKTLNSILKQLENIQLSPKEIRKLRQEEQKHRTFLNLLE